MMRGEERMRINGYRFGGFGYQYISILQTAVRAVLLHILKSTLVIYILGIHLDKNKMHMETHVIIFRN
jgi:hypothetical protein